MYTNVRTCVHHRGLRYCTAACTVAVRKSLLRFFHLRPPAPEVLRVICGVSEENEPDSSADINDVEFLQALERGSEFFDFAARIRVKNVHRLTTRHGMPARRILGMRCDIHYADSRACLHQAPRVRSLKKERKKQKNTQKEEGDENTAEERNIYIRHIVSRSLEADSKLSITLSISPFVNK